MNAVIALCHFCEMHGPCAIFSTQTLRDTKIEDLKIESTTQNNNCPACNSIGSSAALVSKDDQSNATFLSVQTPVFQEVTELLKQASIRSLSCEIGTNKEGGLVFFGDASRGHVLSYTFHISDVQARGLYQLYSIIILMKDKYFLLNTQPFLSQHLERISKELQDYAQKVYDNEQTIGSVRERRLSGAQIPIQTSRSLIELTGEKDVFPILHSHFTWVLLAGTRYLTEHMTFGNLPWLSDNNEENNYTTNGLPETSESTPNTAEDETEHIYSLRYVREDLKDNFVAACFCVLTGVKVIIRGPLEKCEYLAMCLQKLLPIQMHKLIKINNPEGVTNSEVKIVTVGSEIAVPILSDSIFRIDILEDSVCVKWAGELPSKYPDLLRKVIKAVEEPLFNELVLNKHTIVLIEEWKNKIICVNRVRSGNDVAKLKKVLGIQQQDEALVNYWRTYL